MPEYYMLSFSSHQDRAASFGETVSFYGTLLDTSRRVLGATIKWRIERNACELVAVGEYPSNSYLSGASFKAEKNGWYKCTFEAYLEGKRVATTAVGALVERETIKPTLPVPVDFDEFWQRQRERVDAIPMNLRLTPLENDSILEVFDLQADCTNDTPVSGILARPVNAKKGGHPAILVTHGAGVRSAGEGRFLSFAAKGFLSLDINAHGLPNGKPVEFYDKLGNGELMGYPLRGFDTGDLEKVYMLGVFHRVYRALEALIAMPEWDGRNLWLFGGSQASWQSCVGAALMPKVSGMAVWIPAGADMAGGGWPFNYYADKPVPESMRRTMPYFDSTSFATRIDKIPVICEAGLIDMVCKADGVMAAYNSLATPDKTLNLHYQMGHETLESEIAEMERFIMTHLINS